jgi:hypothetical protein
MDPCNPRMGLPGADNGPPFPQVFYDKGMTVRIIN